MLQGLFFLAIVAYAIYVGINSAGYTTKTVYPPDPNLDARKTNLSYEQIEHYISILRKRLPQKPTANNLPFHFEHPADINTWPDHRLEPYFKNYVAEVCKFLRLPKSIHVIFTKTMKEPGKYIQFEGLQHIQIRPGLAEKSVYWAVISHEIAHYYLYTYNVVLQGEHINEMLTEVAAIYFGFGFQLLEGYQTFSWEEGQMRRSESVGYINRASIMRGIVATAKARKQHPYHIISKFPTKEDRLWAQGQLADLIKAYEAHRASSR